MRVKSVLAVDALKQKHQQSVAKTLASTIILTAVSVAPPPFDLAAAASVDGQLLSNLIVTLCSVLITSLLVVCFLIMHFGRCRRVQWGDPSPSPTTTQERQAQKDQALQLSNLGVEAQASVRFGPQSAV